MSELEPDILYRYMSCEGDKIKRLEQILQENVIYFPSPSLFNDPFDCAIGISLECSYEKKLQVLLNGMTQAVPELPVEEKLRRARKLIDVGALAKIDMNAITKEIMQFVGILSMSAIRDNLLMWSHYANKHQGVCVGFKVVPIDPFFGNCYPVIYREEYPETAISDSEIEITNTAFLTKSSDWAYEREYRIIENINGPGLYKFPSHLLSEIIIGCQAPIELREKVIGMARNHPTKPQVFQAEIAPREFRLLSKKLI